MFDMALEALESVLSQKAARSCLEAGLNVQGKAPETASLEDYRAALRSNVFRQLQVVMPATSAAQLIREVEFQLEQLDNERTETDSRRAGSKPGLRAAVPQTMVDESKSTSIRDPDLLAMAGSNLMTLNLRSLGSLSVEFGDVLFAERDLKLEVRAMRRLLDEGQQVEREKIEHLRDTLRTRREALLTAQRAQLEMLDRQIYELSQRIVVPRELEARLDSARRLLASGTLATSDLRQMERLVETVTGEPIVVSEPAAAVMLDLEPVLEADHDGPTPVADAILDPESTSVFTFEPEADLEPVLVVEEAPAPTEAVALEPEPQHAIESEPQAVSEPALEFEPIWVPTEERGSIRVEAAPAQAEPVVADAFEPGAGVEPRPEAFTSARAVVYGSWDASSLDSPVADSGVETVTGDREDGLLPDSDLELSGGESFEPVVSAEEMHYSTPENVLEADPVIASLLRSPEAAQRFELRPDSSGVIEHPEPSLETISATETVAAVVFEPEPAAVVAAESERAARLESETEVSSGADAVRAAKDEPEITEPEIHSPGARFEADTEPEGSDVADLESQLEASPATVQVVEPESEADAPEETLGAEPELEVVSAVIEADTRSEPEVITAEPEPFGEQPEPAVASGIEPSLQPEGAVIEVVGQPEPALETAPFATAALEPERSEHLESELTDSVSEPVVEPVASEGEPGVATEPEAVAPITEPEPAPLPEPAYAEARAVIEPEPEAVHEPVVAQDKIHTAEDQAPEPLPEAAPIVEAEPDTMLDVQRAPTIEPDRGSWYPPGIAAPQVETVVHDGTPVSAPSYFTANSGFLALREETQVENETVQEHVEAPVQTRDTIANPEEGIVWLASARRDASSRNADRLRKDPMALKPGRLESEHGLAEAEAHVLEAKLHAACDGAGLQHRRLEAEFALKVAQAAVELASKRVEAVSLRERYGAASKAELEHAQLELERAQEELALARLSEGVVPNVPVNGEPAVNRVEVDAERLKVALQSTPQMLSARHTLERTELELAIRDNPAYPASEIASVRNVVNQAREHFSTLEATLHAELEAALASMRYYGARMAEKESAWKTAESELHHAEEGVRQGFVASLTRDESQLKALRADSEKRKAAHKYLEAVHRLQCLTHQYMLG